MGGIVLGVVCGGAFSLLTMFALGVLHRYVFGPAMSPFGDPAFFTDMTAPGLAALIALRVLAAWIGASVAVRLSDAPHAVWSGPVAVMGGALFTVLGLGMGQPLWTLMVSAALVFLAGLMVGRLHVGLSLLPGLPGGRDG